MKNDVWIFPLKKLYCRYPGDAISATLKDYEVIREVIERKKTARIMYVGPQEEHKGEIMDITPENEESLRIIRTKSLFRSKNGGRDYHPWDYLWNPNNSLKVSPPISEKVVTILFPKNKVKQKKLFS